MGGGLGAAPLRGTSGRPAHERRKHAQQASTLPCIGLPGSCSPSEISMKVNLITVLSLGAVVPSAASCASTSSFSSARTACEILSASGCVLFLPGGGGKGGRVREGAPGPRLESQEACVAG